MSRLPSLCHPLLLLLVLSSFLCFVIQQNLISLSILYYSFSPFPLLSCPYFLFCFPLDKVLNMMSLKAISMVVVHNTTSLHHTSPADRDLNAPVRIFLMIFFFSSQALTASGFLCVVSNFSTFGDGTPQRMKHKPKQS